MLTFRQFLTELASEEVALNPDEVRNMTERFGRLDSEQMVSMLQSLETLVDRVSEARKRKLALLVGKFQSEPNDAAAHQRWSEIEKMVFGVEFRD